MDESKKTTTYDMIENIKDLVKHVEYAEHAYFDAKNTESISALILDMGVAQHTSIINASLMRRRINDANGLAYARVNLHDAIAKLQLGVEALPREDRVMTIGDAYYNVPLFLKNRLDQYCSPGINKL